MIDRARTLPPQKTPSFVTEYELSLPPYPPLSPSALLCKRALYLHKRALCLSTKEPYLHIRKKALYLHKRALCLSKRALYLHKRALSLCKRALYLHQRALCLHQRALNILHIHKKALHNSICAFAAPISTALALHSIPQKSPMAPQKSPVHPAYLQKRPA